MVSVPKVRAGDMVFWLPDLIHAVEAKHNGDEDSAVFYMPVLPATRVNLDYVRRQADRFERAVLLQTSRRMTPKLSLLDEPRRVI